MNVARAALACAAVYAFLLQALLAAALPHPDFALAGEVLCAHETAGPDQTPPAPGAHKGCCVLACAAPMPVLAPSAASLPWPMPGVQTLPPAWAAAGLAARPPPIHHVSPRGPPAA